MTLSEDILANLDIVDIVWRYVQLKRVWRNFAWLCPFHNEKSPSFTVAPDKQIFKCFWCGMWGNAIKFTMEIEKIEIWDAIKILSKDANIDLDKYKIDDQKMDKWIKDKEKFKLVNKHAQTFFTDCYAKNGLAKEYVSQKRKLSDQIVKQFGIGYAPDSHYDMISFLNSKWFSDDDIIRSGLASRWSTWDIYAFFRNRLMFPIFDHMGNIVAFAGRALKSDDNPKYLNIPETLLYDKSSVLYGLNFAKENVKKHGKMIVVEWYMDVIGLARAGIWVWVATCGTAMTPKHMKLSKRFSDNLVLAFDNDKAWNSATIRGLKIAYESDIFPQVIRLPEQFKDIDEYVNSIGSDSVEFDQVDGFEFVLNNLIKSLNMDSPIDRKKLNNECFDLLLAIGDFSIRDFYLQKMSTALKVNYSSLIQAFEDHKRHLNVKTVERTKVERKINIEPEEKYLIGSLFYDWFMDKNQLSDQWLGRISDLLISISNQFPDSLFNKILNKSIDFQEKETIKDAQMRWEKQIDDLQISKKVELIKNFLLKQIHKMYKIVSKSKNISETDKDNIFKQIKQISK